MSLDKDLEYGMKSTVKMIVTDLDGTLLRTDKTISSNTETVMRQCREAGIKVVYATGRGGSSELVAPTELFDGRITMNGAIAKVGDETVYYRIIPIQTACPILTACDKRGIKITSENTGMHYSNFVVSDIWPYVTDFRIVDFSQHRLDTEKIYVPDPAKDDIAFIKQLLPDDLYFILTADVEGFLGQIMHKDATKALAVAALARYWGLSQSEIVAFGDDLNDTDMLSSAGIGVAMGNAHDDVKAASDFICSSNDSDGLAEWLLSYIDI